MGRSGLMLREIERRVLLAGDTPGVILRSTLAPGKTEGATVLLIDGKYQAVSETLTFDNTLSKALGRTTLGAGLEVALPGNWSAKAEYLRVDLGSFNCTGCSAVPPDNVSLQENIFRAGVNYRLGWGK